MVELVDSVDLGSSVLDVQVRVLLPAPKKEKANAFSFLILESRSIMVGRAAFSPPRFPCRILRRLEGKPPYHMVKDYVFKKSFLM